MPVPLALALAGPAIKAGVGAFQAAAGARQKKRLGERPKYQTPTEVGEALKRKRLRAQSTRLPGQSEIEENIQRTTSSAIRAAEDAGADPYSYIDVLTKAKMGEMTQKRALGVQAAEMQDKNQRELDQALITTAGYKDKEFADEASAYGEKANVASALLGSGLENITGGLTDAASVGAAKYGDPKKTTTGA